MSRNENLKQCPIHYALHGIGDKWSLIIIRDLIFFGKRHYNEFLASREGISTNILADRLAKLEEHGIISKTRDKKSRNRFRYLLTQKGLDLLPVLVELTQWGGTYDSNTAIPSSYLEQYRTDRAGLLDSLLQRYHAVNREQE